MLDTFKDVELFAEKVRSGRLKEVIPGAFELLEIPRLPPCGACHRLRAAKRFDSQNGHKSEENGVVLGVVIDDDDKIYDKWCALAKAKKKWPELTDEKFEEGLKPYNAKVVPGLYVFKPRASKDSP